MPLLMATRNLDYGDDAKVLSGVIHNVSIANCSAVGKLQPGVYCHLFTWSDSFTLWNKKISCCRQTARQ